MIKKVFFINIFLVIFLVLLLELIFNIFKLSGLMGIERGLIYKKGDTFFLNTNKKGEIFNEIIFTDNFGFRAPKENFRYNSEENIFILGDSVAFGNGVKEENTFIGLLRKSIKNKNLLNSSVPGYQIKNQVENIEIMEKFENIEKIIYFFTLNDVYGSSNIKGLKKERTEPPKSNEGSFFLKNFQILKSINNNLRNKSYLYMYIKGISTDPSKRWFQNLYKHYEKSSFDQTSEQLKKIRNFSKNINSDFLIVILPYEFQIRKCSDVILLPQNQIQNILKQLNIKYLDLTKNFCELNNSKKYFYKFDPMHLSKKGHKFVYDILKDEINF